MKPKVGIYTLIGSYSYRSDLDGEDMISPHTRSNLLSDIPIEEFVRSEWVLDGYDQDFIEFWRQVREYERNINYDLP